MENPTCIIVVCGSIHSYESVDEAVNFVESVVRRVKELMKCSDEEARARIHVYTRDDDIRDGKA